MPHIHEKIDFTATAFIVYKNTVLLRVHDKYKTWLGVGGHIELDENPNQAVIREVKEEVGLNIELSHTEEQIKTAEYTTLIPPDFMNIHKVSDAHQHMDMIYLVESTSNDVIPEGGDQSDDWKWFTKEELDDPKYEIRPIVVFYAKKALEKYS
ncbi:MAG: Mut/nudix family protein [Candidatus Doudnabacteria bacterium Gr01-1014_77]|uniref:Mut/nudix family protein n=1 Tax=Candidatus Doudnabacteria bacterium Gr01-1014_77 TaxID=2017133 RepID=A0A554JDK6_9BACT|nr:MAG: Mut/nudix family protein [Candidatus Doudnabacteria bacterium Gr01-1014_77]